MVQVRDLPVLCMTEPDQKKSSDGLDRCAMLGNSQTIVETMLQVFENSRFQKPVHACDHPIAKSRADHAITKLRDCIIKLAVDHGPAKGFKERVSNLGRPTVEQSRQFLLFAISSAFPLDVPCPVISFLPALPHQDVCHLPVPSRP